MKPGAKQKKILIRAIGAFLSFCMVLLVQPAHATEGAIGQPLRVCVLRDTGGQSPAELFRHPERFDCATPQKNFGTGSYWVLSEPIDRMSKPGDPLAMRVASMWQKGLDLHILYGDGRILSFFANDSGMSRLIQIGAIIEHRVPARAAPVQRVLWHVKDTANLRGILIGAHLATTQQSDRHAHALTALYAAFGGMCVALIIYNLALWGALRYRFQLAYCSMVAWLLFYALTSSGGLAWMVPDIPNTLRLRLNYLGIGGVASSALLFARTYFEPSIFSPTLHRVIRAMAIVFAATGFGVFLLAPYAIVAADRFFSLAFLGLPLVVLPLLWAARARRSRYFWLFLFSWAAPMATTFARALFNLGLVPWNFWLDNSTIIAMALEAVISSLAIAYRLRILSQERDQALAAEIAARRLADTDPLTGLLNRRAFLERAIGSTGTQTLLLADLDHFKQINEAIGHDGGDEALRIFARLLRTSVPPGVLVARIGGEEFAILANADKSVDGEYLLSRLRATRMPFDVPVTASIGSCSGPLANERDWKRLYRAADTALFEAKSHGRDRSRRAVLQAA